MSEGNDKIKDRIRKLLNLANDPGAFQGEIENAVAAARKLMNNHNISEAELMEENVSVEEQARRSKYAQQDTYTAGVNVSLWENWLMIAICELVGTVNSYKTSEVHIRRNAAGLVERDIYGAIKQGTRLVFYGPEEDARDAAGLFEEWSVLICAMARLKFGGAFKGPGRSYAEGFVTALLMTVRKAKAEEQKALAHESSSRALVVVKAGSLVEAKKAYGQTWLEKEKGIKLSKNSGYTNRNDQGAFSEGAADGRKAGFSHTRTKKLGA